MQQQISSVGCNYSIQQQYQCNMGQRIWTVDWDQTGNILAAAGSNKTVTIWKYIKDNNNEQFVEGKNKGRLEKIHTIDTQHSKTIRCIKFSYLPNQKQKNVPSTNYSMLAVGSFDSTISVWVYAENGETSQEISGKQYEQFCLLEGHQSQVKCLSWNYNNTKIASCSRDKNVWIWEFDEISYEYICENVLQGHTQDVKFVQWVIPAGKDLQTTPSFNFNKLISCGYDDSIRVWDLQDDDYVCLQVLTGHESIVWSLCFNYSCSEMISVGQDCSLIIWKEKQSQKGRKYEIQQKFQSFHMFPIYTCQYSQLNDASSLLLTGSGDNSIKISEMASTKNSQYSLKQIKQLHHDSDVNYISLRPQTSKKSSIINFVSCSDDETIKLWRISKEAKVVSKE